MNIPKIRVTELSCRRSNKLTSENKSSNNNKKNKDTNNSDSNKSELYSKIKSNSNRQSPWFFTPRSTITEAIPTHKSTNNTPTLHITCAKPVSRTGHAQTHTRTHLYIFGGRSRSNIPLNDAWKFSFSEWMGG